MSSARSTRRSAARIVAPVIFAMLGLGYIASAAHGKRPTPEELAWELPSPGEKAPPHLEKQRDPYIPRLKHPHTSPRPRNVGPSVQVNVDGLGQNIVGDAANEPSIAIDPTNPQRIAIGWRQFDTIVSNFRQAGVAFSTDGGATWTASTLNPGVFRSDPVLGADNAGRIYYNSLKNNFCIDVFRSTDGGATWPSSFTAFGGDKQWMDIDRTGGIGSGFLYQAWQPAAICSGSGLFTRSTNNGATWMMPIAVTNSPRFGTTTVGPDGAVYVTGTTSSSSTFVVAKSTNAQNSGVTPTWAFSVTGNFLGGATVLNGSLNPGGLSGQVWLCVNPLNANHVYLLCSVDPTGSDPMDVRFARSTNGGSTWNASIRVNDDPTNNNAVQWFGTLSVAPNGRLDAVWNDTRDDPANEWSRLYYSFSEDGGVNWSASYGLTPPWNSLVGFPNQNKIGDYYHMVSDDNAASLAYAATFNGEQDVYFLRITPNDCNTNATADDADVLGGTSVDCNTNNLPDECENDCNQNGTADVCELAGGDCNTNNVPDDCDPGNEDCNTNGTLDQCEGVFNDCNGNGHLDACDILLTGDCDTDGVPNDCELPSGVDAADACANAPFITPGLLYEGRNTAATTDPGSGTSCVATTGRDVYYRYRPVSSGSLSLSLCSGTFFDTVMSVHTGCPGTAANQVPGACDDDFCGGGSGSAITGVAVTAGTTYFIRIAGFNNGGSGGDTGSFALTLTGPTGVGDCDTNGVPDDCQIAAGGDANTNGIPDTCDPFPACGTCPGDLTGDNRVDAADIQGFVACRVAAPGVPGGCGCADMDGSHQINNADVSAFVTKLLGAGDPNPACP